MDGFADFRKTPTTSQWLASFANMPWAHCNQFIPENSKYSKVRLVTFTFTLISACHAGWLLFASEIFPKS